MVVGLSCVLDMKQMNEIKKKYPASFFRQMCVTLFPRETSRLHVTTEYNDAS
jgi:hypothetical protein